MAEGGGVLRRLVAIIGLDFQKNDFDKAEQALQGVKNSLNGLVGLVAGGLIAHGFKEMVLGAVEAADAVQKTATKLGISTNALQELQYAAKLSGVNSEGLGQSLKFLSRNSAEAAHGSKEAQGAFASLGVGVTDAHGKVLPTEDLLMRVAGAMENVHEPAERVRLAMKLFGRDGASIIPMLAEGSAGLNAMREEARQLGGMFDPEFVAQSVEIDNNIKRLEASFQGMKNMVVATVLPAVNWLVKAMISGWKSIKEWLKGTNVVKAVLLVLAAASGAAAVSATNWSRLH
jgi:TP901 family phage tail tape measure protein